KNLIHPLIGRLQSSRDSGRARGVDMEHRPQLTRRRLLQLGGIGMLGLGLPELLRAGRARHASEKSCLFIVQYGGASHHDSWDLKPDAPAEVRGPYKPVSTSVPGTKICELMPRLARLADRYCIVRSM